MPGEFYGWRNLSGDGPWSYKESDLTEQLTFTFTFKTNAGLWKYVIQGFDTMGCCTVRGEGISFRRLEGDYINALYLREALEVQIQTFNLVISFNGHRNIKKQRHYFANKGPSSQGCFFQWSCMDVRVGL